MWLLNKSLLLSGSCFGEVGKLASGWAESPFVTPMKCDRFPQVMSHESRLVGVGDDRFKKGKKSRVWCQEVVQRSSGALQPLPTYPTPPAPLIWLGSLALFIHFTFSGLQSCCIGGEVEKQDRMRVEAAICHLEKFLHPILRNCFSV